MTIDNIDRIVAVLAGGLCIAAAITGFGLRNGAGIFPLIAGSLGALTCLVLGLETWLLPNTEPAPPELPRRRLVLWSLCLVGFLLMMPTAGALVTLPLFMVIALRLFAGLRWTAVLSIALGFTAVIYLIFVSLLSVPLPVGLLGE